MDRITQADLTRALEAHVTALEKCGITYSGRMGLSHGSKPNGIAYRLYVTDFDYHCQETKWHLTPAGNYNGIDYSWDHANCKRCHGTKREICSGHNNPPVGDDYLGMTAREAYDALTSRTRAIYDVASAIDQGKKP